MLGIDLEQDGVTPNDPGDTDTGANNRQNFPLLTSAIVGSATTTIAGTLNSTPSKTFTIQFFSNPACDSSGNGEGQTFLGSTSVMTDALGNANINATFSGAITIGHVVTATATDGNDTSEFSACRIVVSTSFLQFSAPTYNAAEDAGLATITVSRTGNTSGTASVQFSTPAAGGTATGGTSCSASVDFINTAGTLFWADGDAADKTFPITICNDTIFESNETVNLVLSNPSSAELGPNSAATLTINENDSQPTISITDVTQAEGDSGTTGLGFTVTLSNPTIQTVTVNYATANGTATAGSDYQPISTTLIFNPGATSMPVNVSVIGDTLNEANESFSVNLSGATNATIADNQGVGTINNDDAVAGNLMISGRIVDDSALSVSGVLVILNGTTSGSTTTDSNGSYSFANLGSGTYAIAPSSNNYSFSPASQTFNNLSVNSIANFVATQTIVSISGKVTDANNAGLNNVMVELFKDGVSNSTVQTDSAGNYSFTNLAAGSNYAVTPTGNFAPSSQAFDNLNTNTTANFIIAPPIPPQCNTLTFGRTDYPTGSFSSSVAVGDFNNDGQRDLVTANQLSANLSILLGSGNGGFAAATNISLLGASYVTVGDFNNDGNLDLVTANASANPDPQSVSILIGTGTGSFGMPTSFPAGGASSQFVAVGDLNNDGKLDLAVANFSSNSVSILIGTGTGSFGNPGTIPLGINPRGILILDFNGDSNNDLGVVNTNSGNVAILLGTGTGSFGSATNFSAGSNPRTMASGDFNSDGKMDLAVANRSSGNVSILLGDGTGSFGSATSFAAGTSLESVAVSDFNSDGKSDVAVSGNSGVNNVSLLLGTGTGSFAPVMGFSVASGAPSLAVGDFNADGRSDLATANSFSNNASVLLNNSPACNAQTSLAISGGITGGNSILLAGVNITLSGPITRVTQTDASGNYSFANLAPGGNYAVTVQTPYYVFAPTRADFFNLGSNQTANFTAAPVVVPLLLPPPNDDFNSPTRDPNKWNLGTQTLPPTAVDPLVNVAQINGQLRIQPLAQVSGLHYNGYVSANSFDLRGGSVSVELVQAATGGADTIFAIGSDSDNFYRFVVHSAGPATSLARTDKGIEASVAAPVPELLFQVRVGGILTALSIPYDPVQHRFMRFRHEALANAILFETSPNNVDFTERHRVVLVRSVSALTAELSAGTSNPTNPGATIFDNFGLVTSTFQFSSASYTVDEGGDSILITVTRAGSLATTAAVDYATADGTALQTTKYIIAAGRLMFAPGEPSKTFRVLIVDNAQAEGNQNLNLLLQEPAASGLNTPGRAVLNIIDNDTTVATSNPLDDPTFYVRQHYYDFLNREPDPAGLAFWVNQITSCGSDRQCVEIRRINVSAAYFLSIEFQETGYLVHRFYNLALNRPNGLPRYLEFFRDTQAIGLGVIVGNPGFQQLLEANKVAYADEFAARAEFTALYPLGQPPAAYVDALYLHAGITPDAAERQAAIDEFNNPTGARGRVLRRVAANQTLNTREFNRAFVLAQYFGYLRRNPDDVPDNNLDGFNFWLNKLNQFNGNFINAEMVKAFITSIEYRHRFGP